MRMRQTCIYVIAGSVLLFQGLAHAEQSKSRSTDTIGQSSSDGSSGSMKSQPKHPQGSKGVESYQPSTGAKEGSDSTLPDPTTMPYPDKGAKKGKGSSGGSGSGSSGSMGSSGGTGSSGGSGGGY
ncbi:MAG: hypothetical protein AB7L09_26630 [Nitrospira sp.]